MEDESDRRGACALIAAAALFVFLSRDKNSASQSPASQVPATNAQPDNQFPARAIVANTEAKTNGSHEITKREAIVDFSGDEPTAEFVFTFDTTGVWRWALDDSKNDTYENIWEVHPQTENEKQYLIGIFYKKKGGDEMEEGSLKSLLSESRRGVYLDGNWLKETIVEYSVTDDSLALTIRGKVVKTIFASRPKEAQFKFKRGDQKMIKVYDETIKYIE